MGNPFRSFGNVQILNQPEPPTTREEMAADLAIETCERYKALRAEALTAEANADLPLAWSPQAAECIATLEALAKGPHGWVVKPILLEQFPEFARPVSEMEKAVVDEFIAARDSQVDLKP